MLKYSEALKIIGDLRFTLESEELPLGDCTGRVLAKPVIAPFPSPSFTNSAMDGIALKHADALKNPNLKTQGFIFANRSIDFNEYEYIPGHCVQIMTGAPVPQWADTVVPVEQITLKENDQIVVRELSDKGGNIRREGEDIKAGETLLVEGNFLTPEKLMVCASFGFLTLQVYKQPDVVLLSSGDELLELGEERSFGGIYNSSKYFLTAALGRLGLKVQKSLHLVDDPAKAEAILQENLNFDRPTLILSTGAVSAGVKDFIPDLARKLGFETLIHKVAVRPGKPLFLAKKHQLYWFGLPGNPISTVTSWHFFVRAFLAAAAHYPAIHLEKVPLSTDLSKPEALCCFYRGAFDGISVRVSPRQGSAHLLASTEANTYIVLLDGISELKAGTTVDVLRI
jgi:molybdopterin molybdotransferase